jgi:hypothetical protein
LDQGPRRESSGLEFHGRQVDFRQDRALARRDARNELLFVRTPDAARAKVLAKSNLPSAFHHFGTGGTGGGSFSFWMQDAKSKKKNASADSPSFSGAVQERGYWAFTWSALPFWLM